MHSSVLLTGSLMFMFIGTGDCDERERHQTAEHGGNLGGGRGTAGRRMGRDWPEDRGGTLACQMMTRTSAYPARTAAPAGSVLPVKTKIPSDVLGSASALASGVWMKKPLLLTPVTIPVVVTVCPTTGEVAPLP